MYLQLLVKSMLFVCVLGAGAYILVRFFKKNANIAYASSGKISILESKTLSAGFTVYIVDISGITYHVFKSSSEIIVKTVGVPTTTESALLEISGDLTKDTLNHG